MNTFKEHEYSKTCLKHHSKIDKTKIFMTNGNLMKVESIAECFPWSILQYIWSALSDDLSWKPILVFSRVAILYRFMVQYDSWYITKHWSEYVYNFLKSWHFH